MTENWQRWQSSNKELAGSYAIESVTDSMQKLKIILSHEQNAKKKLCILFEQSVYAYNSTDEGLRLLLIDYLHEYYGQSFYVGWTIFQVTNSSYMKWLSEQSYETSNTMNLLHFSILGTEFFIDVIAKKEPEIMMANCLCKKNCICFNEV